MVVYGCGAATGAGADAAWFATGRGENGKPKASDERALLACLLAQLGAGSRKVLAVGSGQRILGRPGRVNKPVLSGRATSFPSMRF